MNDLIQLPPNWNWVTVAEVVAPERSSCVTGPFGSSIGKKFWMEEGVPVIRGNNLTTDGVKFIDDDFVFISPQYADELTRYSAVAGDIVFTAAGTLGQVGIIPSGTKFPRYIISNKQMRLRVDLSKVNSLYAFYWFRSATIQDLIIRQNTGSSVPLINLSILRSLPFPLSPLPTQHRIADILGALDDQIECNRRINQKLEAMAQTLYKHWFIDASVDEERPITDWMVIDPPVKIIKGADAVYVDMKALPTWSMSITETARRPYSAGSKFQNGDTLLARITPCLENGKTAFVDFLEDGEAAFGSTEFIVLRAKPGISPQFVYCVAREESFREHAIKSMVGSSGRQRVRPENLQRFLLPTVSEEKMRAFHERTAQWFAQIQSNVKENKALAQTRDYLLPRLLSGEIEVKAAEEIVADER